MASLVAGCGSGSGNTGGKNSNELVPAVEAVQAQYGSLPLTERLSGIVKAKNQVEIYPEISAPIVKVHVANGDEVRKGDPLVTLRDTEVRERLNQAKASLQIARAQATQADAELNKVQSEFKRTQSLAEKNLTSETELESGQAAAISAKADADLATARVAQAQATVDERQEALAKTIIRAPVSGTVGNRDAEVGMLVGNNTRLFTLGQLDTMRIEIVLTDRMLNYIETQQHAEIFSPALRAGSINAKLSRISPFLHPVTHSTDGEIDINNPEVGLRPGMFVTVDIHYGESEKATLIPMSALYENPRTGETGVYICQDSSLSELEGTTPGENAPLTGPYGFTFQPVSIIARGRMEAAVGGVKPGQWVATVGLDLFNSETGSARVRPVNWQWVDHLQQLQRENLLDDLMNNQQAVGTDTSFELHHVTPE